MSEVEKVDTKEILSRHPEIDVEQIKTALVAVKEMRAIGVARSEYSLTLPFSRKPPVTPLGADWPKR